MNGSKRAFIAMLALAAPVFAQPAPRPSPFPVLSEPPAPPVPPTPVVPLTPVTPQALQPPQAPQAPQLPAPFPAFSFDVQIPDVHVELERAQAELVRAQAELSVNEFDKNDFKETLKQTIKTATTVDVAGLVSGVVTDSIARSGLLMLQNKNRPGRFEADYDSGTRALDDHKYEDAVRRFDSVIDSKSSRADGALYWKAYALNRMGRRDDALAAIAVLRRDYPASHWLNDAQVLEAEVKQSSGQAVSPAQENNDDLKLMAINSLMAADPERVMPLLEGLLKGNSSPKVKDRALFVLTQSRTPRAQQILMEYAKGAGNPDLQSRAIRYVAMSGTNDAAPQLSAIYSASNDTAIKRQIIQSLMIARGQDALFNLARSEKNDELRGDAITQLGAMRATDQLSQLYASETSPDNKVQIVRALFIAGATDKLLDLIRNEKETKVRNEAIRSFAMSRASSIDTLTSLYTSDSDQRSKKELVNGLVARGDAKPLIDLARKETDPVMKNYIVQRLGGLHSKEATDYMIELLK